MGSPLLTCGLRGFRAVPSHALHRFGLLVAPSRKRRAAHLCLHWPSVRALAVIKVHIEPFLRTPTTSSCRPARAPSAPGA